MADDQEPIPEGFRKEDFVVPPNPDPRWKWTIHFGFMLVGGSAWRKRFFVLNHKGELFYFKGKTSTRPRKKAVIVKDMKFNRSSIRRNAIEIERYPKSFFVRPPEANSMLEWLNRIKLAGGRYIELAADITKPELAEMRPPQWSHDHVKEWLEYNYYGTESFSKYEELFSNVDGKHLVKMSDRELSQMGIKKYQERKSIIKAIRDLKSHGFNYERACVSKKLHKMLQGKFGSLKGDSQDVLAGNLSSSEKMCQTYLDPEILEETMLEDTVLQDDPEHSARDEDTEALDLVDESIQVEMVSASDQGDAVRLPVKLVITEVIQSARYRTVRRLLSPVMARLPKYSQTFGVFHTALIVGPWYLEWNNSSLVIPRKLSSSMALLSADVDSSQMTKDLTFPEIARKIADVVTNWNTTKTYDNLCRKNPSLGNCQQFVEDVMAALNLYLKKDGAFGRFLESMRKKGQCKMVFKPTDAFKQKFGLSSKNFRFDTHAELDSFFEGLAKVDEIGLRVDYKEEVKLLKSFDRAFWLRHLKHPTDDRFKPLPSEGRGRKKTACPFDDPRDTKSFVMYK